MFRTSAFAVCIIILSSTYCARPQEPVEDENWLYMGGHYSGAARIEYQLKSFTLEDVATAKGKLNLIRSAGFDSEWEGVYSHSDALGDHQMVWNSESGYFQFYYYHLLKYLDFGKASETRDGVRFETEKRTNAGNATLATDRFLVKVRVGNRRYLVPLKYLSTFCKRAVGRAAWSTTFDYDYWLHDEDVEKPAFGIPVVDRRFAKFIRRPIEAKIISVGGYYVDREFSGEISKDSFRRQVTIDAGANRGVLRGMNFFVDYLGEWVAIERVFRTRSVGYLRRSFDDDENRIVCWNAELGSGDYTPCKSPRVGLRLRTKMSDTYY